MDDIRNLVSRAIVQSPYGRLLGVVCEKVDVDCVAVRRPFRDDVTTIGDMVHGGAIAGLCYLAAGRAQDLTATARVIQRGSSICVAEVDVAGADGTAVARAIATYKLSAPPRH